MLLKWLLLLLEWLLLLLLHHRIILSHILLLIKRIQIKIFILILLSSLILIHLNWIILILWLLETLLPIFNLSISQVKELSKLFSSFIFFLLFDRLMRSHYVESISLERFGFRARSSCYVEVLSTCSSKALGRLILVTHAKSLHVRVHHVHVCGECSILSWHTHTSHAHVSHSSHTSHITHASHGSSHSAHVHASHILLIHHWVCIYISCKLILHIISSLSFLRIIINFSHLIHILHNHIQLFNWTQVLWLSLNHLLLSSRLHLLNLRLHHGLLILKVLLNLLVRLLLSELNIRNVLIWLLLFLNWL